MKTIDVSTKSYPGLVALVSDEDFHLLNQFSWTAEKRRGAQGFYAIRTERIAGKRHMIRMHRQVMGFPSLMVDHEDLDGLNNTRGNLRLATNSQNQHNTTKKRGAHPYKGVNWSELSQAWVSTLTAKGVQFHLGIFSRPEAAALAYNLKALEILGEFARPTEGLRITRAEMEQSRRPKQIGEDSYNAKLTADEVLAIRAADGVQRLIAEQFAISQTLVSAIKLRKVWGHLP